MHLDRPPSTTGLHGRTGRPDGGINSWPRSIRPRERLLRDGSVQLSDAELIAIVLRTGSPATGQSAVDLATELLDYAGVSDNRQDPLWGLASCRASELLQVKGIGHAKAASVEAAFELGRRVQSRRLPGQRVESPADAYDYVAGMAYLDREHFRIILLDTKNQVLGLETVSIGGLSNSPVHPREVFKPAIRQGAAALVLVHNHPSGDAQPSQPDVAITERLVTAGMLLGIDVFDHLVIGEQSYTSLRQGGYLEFESSS